MSHDPYTTLVQLSTGHVVLARSLTLDDLLVGARAAYAPYIGELRTRYGDELERAIETLVQDDAAELIDDLFMSLPRILRGYDESGRFHAWLFGAAINRARTRARSERRRPDSGEMPVAYEPGQDSDIVEQLTMSAVLDRALEILSPGERQAWLLSYQGYAPADIAQELGIEISAATVRVHRARKRLAEQLRDLLVD